MPGLNCVENCLNCHLRSRSFFCNLTPASMAAFNAIKHAAVFPEHAVVLVEGQNPSFSARAAPNSQLRRATERR